MFNKKCDRCGRKIEKDHDFCPYCGRDFRFEKKKNRQEDYGFLGEDDRNMDFNNFMSPMNLGGIFNSGLFKSLFNQLDKQMKNLDKEMTKDKKLKPSNSLSISISTETGKKPKIEVRGYGPNFEKISQELGQGEGKAEKRIPKSEITEEKARQLAKLPKKEAETKVRRMSNRVVYEVELPGVKNLKDIIINKLESSIEIKAFSEKTVYFKLIPVKLPIVNYALQDEKLILELGEK